VGWVGTELEWLGWGLCVAGLSRWGVGGRVRVVGRAARLGRCAVGWPGGRLGRCAVGWPGGRLGGGVVRAARRTARRGGGAVRGGPGWVVVRGWVLAWLGAWARRWLLSELAADSRVDVGPSRPRAGLDLSRAIGTTSGSCRGKRARQVGLAVGLRCVAGSQVPARFSRTLPASRAWCVLAAHRRSGLRALCGVPAQVTRCAGTT
jgi:hypothetical protein